MRRLIVMALLAFPLLSNAQIGFVELDNSKKVPEPKVRDTTVDNWNRSQPGFDKLPAQAKEMVYWTNYARRSPDKFWTEVISPILTTFPSLNKAEANSLREDLTKAGPLPMFSLNAILLRTSQSHAEDIGKHHAPLSHNSTNGADFGTRMKAAGIKYCANENISLCSQSVLLSTVLLYLDIGLAEKGHRKSLLDASLREIGIGSAVYDKDQYFLVQDFACLQQR